MKRCPLFIDEATGRGCIKESCVFWLDRDERTGCAFDLAEVEIQEKLGEIGRSPSGEIIRQLARTVDGVREKDRAKVVNGIVAMARTWLDRT